MSSKNNQDWQTVSIGKKKTDAEKIKEMLANGTATRDIVRKTVQTGPNLQNLENTDDIPKIVTSDLNLSKQIQQARCAKKWTQDDFAKKCCIQSSVIKAYEAGTAVVKVPELERMSKELGIVLKKPHVKK